MHQKLQRLQPALVNRLGPRIVLYNNAWQHIAQLTLQKLNKEKKSRMNWAMKFCLICHINLTSCQLTTTSSSISTTFCRQNASTTSRRQKFFPRVHWIQRRRPSCYRNVLFLIGKNVLNVMVSILINKDVFEPSYSDLKFMVWNSNYFCTNLIRFCLGIRR